MTNDLPRAIGEQTFPVEDRSVAGIKRELLRCMVEEMGRDPAYASLQDWFFALAYFVRGRLSGARIRTWRRNFDQDAKWVYYLSLEFLPGRLLASGLRNMGLLETCTEALAELGIDIETLRGYEVEPALGNGGLGRLAACMLDSMATLGFAGIGYGIRYEYGMFRQMVENGAQVEHPENWLKYGNPWEFGRPNVMYPVHFNGEVAQVHNWRGELECYWGNTDDIIAMGYDVPVFGYDNDTVSTIRLWSAKATTDFNLDYFNRGNYIEAVQAKSESETVSKVLYPSDTTNMGRELRLKQEYFLVSASLHDILSRFEKKHGQIERLPEKVAIQLNDTHPSLAVPELMRILVDERRLGWDTAWDITQRTIAFTNHTLLAEALECWPVELMATLLPRHLQIIYEINQRFLREVTHRHPGDGGRVQRMSLIDDSGPSRLVRMAHLAFVGSHRVNGVSDMHTGIMRATTFRDFDAHFPGRIANLTNGIAHRRWLDEANPEFAKLIDGRIGGAWRRDLGAIARLAPAADDAAFRAAFRRVKRGNKARLAAVIEKRLGLWVDPDAMFDVHVKRIHEYKRQLLNVLQVIARYNRIRHGTQGEVVPRTVIFSGKAAPGYAMAKRILELIIGVADVVNNDPAVQDRLKLAFIPNYDVQTAEDIIPAADLSQQISLAGTEASGTGNMKLALNGAMTLCTRDGANVEIARAVGEDDIFQFGMDYGEVAALRRSNAYDPVAIVEADPELAEVIQMIRSGYFSPDATDHFAPIADALTVQGDRYMLVADFAAYMTAQDQVDAAWRDPDDWARRAILNASRMGGFSADRLVHQYAETVWGAQPVQIEQSNRAEYA